MVAASFARSPNATLSAATAASSQCTRVERSLHRLRNSYMEAQTLCEPLRRLSW